MLRNTELLRATGMLSSSDLSSTQTYLLPSFFSGLEPCVGHVYGVPPAMVIVVAGNISALVLVVDIVLPLLRSYNSLMVEASTPKATRVVRGFS